MNQVELLQKVGVDINTVWSLTLESELGSKWSGGQDMSRVGQVAIKFDIQTEEVQSKLLV